MRHLVFSTIMCNKSTIIFNCFLLFVSISLFSITAKAKPCNNKLKHQQQTFITYYIHPSIGSDANNGTSMASPFKSLKKIETLQLNPGDTIMLAASVNYEGCIKLIGKMGTRNHPITITSTDWITGKQAKNPIIDFKGKANGILIQDCSYIDISKIALTANGYDELSETADMRCGILINNADQLIMTNIAISNIEINDVYYENIGFIRDKNEVKSANGTQKYGWGIRIINKNDNHLIENVNITNCQISNVSHTGIKLTGTKKNIRFTNVVNNALKYTGGPGIQMSEVQYVYVGNNIVYHSGSDDDTRKWGRGSGLWTWGASDVLIEKNQFLHANGPGDSDGAHIDYNCKNIIIQYNLSAYNAGGFCEILGNNYNCAYRYNISINDGYRVKGVNGAFQEGKTLWLSGYQGNNQPRKGPFNSYIYNNTIYIDASIQPKMAFTNTSNGVLIANNIFYSVNPFQIVLGDQNKADAASDGLIANMQLLNNLFLKAKSLPSELAVYDKKAIIGDPNFKNSGGLKLEDYMPMNAALVKNKGILLYDMKAEGVEIGEAFSLKITKDILGRPVNEMPSIGAIEPNK